MFDITKTTFNMAQKRGLTLTVEKLDGDQCLCVWEAKNDMEWLFSYTLTSAGLQWRGNVYLPDDLKEELPALITTEKKLREMVDFIGINRYLLS
ncbi:hypothetical protein [Serratia ureilytica]|uniref:hypothetical protein n=1 Tax=Serratia ureilytica TaxID=300181 RepID=UPI0025791E36|nr:hypothetical protein [Serratia ureilytica]MDM1841070.1 hypothetical protein [Serratia ureilytica]